MAEWQPIETAPKDGSWILVFGSYHEKYWKEGAEWYIEAAMYSDIVGWTNPGAILSGADGLWNVTHWMPLPEPPKESDNG